MCESYRVDIMDDECSNILLLFQLTVEWELIRRAFEIMKNIDPFSDLLNLSNKRI